MKLVSELPSDLLSPSQNLCDACNHFLVNVGVSVAAGVMLIVCRSPTVNIELHNETLSELLNRNY